MEKAIKIRKTMLGESKEEMATQVFRGTKRERQSETQRKADKNSSL